MKKSLLFAAALSFAAAANADVLQLNAEDFGFGSDAVDCAEGTVWGETALGVFSNPFATQHKAVNCKNNNYNVVVFNGTDEIVTAGGVQGQDNPKDADGGNPGISLAEPIQGAVVKFTAAKDGYVYIVAKLSSNKNYYVFEEGSPIGFTLAMEVESDKLPQLLTYTAEGVGEYNNIEDAGWCDWPENVYYNKVLGQEKPEDIKVNGLGVIGFYCYEGCEYLVGAGGSKISWCGAWCGDAPATSVVIKGTDAENPVADFALIGEAGETPETPEEPAVKVLWTNETGEAIPGWGGTFRFCNVEHMTGEEIYAFPMEDWALIKEGTFYAEVEAPANANVRFTTGWWDATYGGNEYNCAQLIQEVNGAQVIEFNIKADGNMYDLMDEHHILFTGSDYTLKSIYVVAEGAGINAVEAENNATVIYNLNGQKVNEVKGLMIRNGKVILVK